MVHNKITFRKKMLMWKVIKELIRKFIERIERSNAYGEK